MGRSNSKPVAETMSRLFPNKIAVSEMSQTLYGQMEESAKLDDVIRKNLEGLGWLWLRSRGSASKSEYVAEMGVPDRTAQRYLKNLVELARVRRTGSGPSTRYEVTHD